MKVVCGTKIGNMKDRDESKRGTVGIVDFPIAPLGPEEVRIKVAYCAICGSDPHIVGGIFNDSAPVGLGHEMSGVICEMGEKAAKESGLKIGDYVGGNFLRYCGSCYYCKTGNPEYCEHVGNQPCMAEYVTWHMSQAVKLPKGVSLLQGCMMEPLSIGVRIMDKANLQTGGRVLISGGGPIGLITCQLFKKRGAACLTLSEPVADRRQLALDAGADYVIDPMTENLFERGMEITEGRGYDVIVELSGVPSAAESVLPLAAKCGTVLYSAMFPKDYQMPLNLFEYCYSRSINISGNYCSHFNFERTALMLPDMDFSAFLRDEQIFEIDDCDKAFAAHLSGKYPKIVIRCNHFDGE